MDTTHLEYFRDQKVVTEEEFIRIMSRINALDVRSMGRKIEHSSVSEIEAWNLMSNSERLDSAIPNIPDDENGNFPGDSIPDPLMTKERLDWELEEYMEQGDTEMEVDEYMDGM